MKILVTGANGYIGNKLAHTLAAKGNEVHAVVRPGSSTALLQHPDITVFEADILEKKSLLNAMNGCQQLYHTAAKVGAWAKYPSEFYKVNVEGTRNTLNAALKAGIERSVFTSTCGVIGPSLYEPMSENDPRLAGFAMDYELSKKMGEDIVVEYANQGMNAVLVSPSKVYGPGNIYHALSANAAINKFLKTGIAYIPSPGTYKACFAFIEDIVNGHLLAMEKGVRGEKYILGGVNISYQDFFEHIRSIATCTGHIIPLPKNIIKGWALLQQLNYRITGRQPLFTAKGVEIIFNNYTFSSEKASNKINYCITPLDEALNKTIQFFKTKNYV